MSPLRLLPPGPGPAGHSGEAFACAYTPDGAYVLSGGWDGHLRLWDSTAGSQAAAFRAGAKPISACAVSPDGQHLFSGSLDGFLAKWDALTHQKIWAFLAHGRPIAAIVFSPDARLLATASWDRNLTLWDPTRDREGRTLAGHADIVAGCRFTPDGRELLSWSYDGTLALWDLGRGQPLARFRSHTDRVTAAAVSPDGRWAASGSRDGALKLWDLQGRQEAAAGAVAAEVRGCFFLLDAASLLALDAAGHIALHAVPGLEKRTELATGLRVQGAALAPSGNRIAVGSETGQVRFVALEDLDGGPLVVTPTRTVRRTATGLQRLFGRSRVIDAYHCTCPVCRQAFDLPEPSPRRPLQCPSCRRPLRVSERCLVGSEKRIARSP